MDARERIEQMTEWAEGEDDPESYEIPKLEQDLPHLLGRQATLRLGPTSRLVSGSDVTVAEGTGRNHPRAAPGLPLDGTAQARRGMARTGSADYHSLDLPLPAVLLYFRAGDAVMACFDDECEYWGQETPEPNLIIPLRADDPASVRQAFAVIETLMRVLVLTVRIKTIIESREKSTCDSASMSEANSN